MLLPMLVMEAGLLLCTVYCPDFLCFEPCLPVIQHVGDGVNCFAENLSPSLHCTAGVALAGDAMALKKLLGAQGKPNTSDLKLRTPLHVAAQEVGLKETKMFTTSKIFS